MNVNTRIVTLLVTVAMVATACSGVTNGSDGPVVPGATDPAPATGSPGGADPPTLPEGPSTAAATTSEVPEPSETPDPDATPPAPTATSSPAQDGAGSEDVATAVDVYWIGPDVASAVATERTVATRGVGRAAVEALIDGPSASEQAAGLTSGVPAGTLLLDLAVADGTATVDLSSEFESGGGATAILGRLAQLTYTLTQFPTVDRVRLLIDGRAVPTFSGEGVVVGDGLVPGDYASSFPVRQAPADAGAPVWDQSELPVVTIGDADVWRVVLVASDDVLNVRRAAGADASIIGKLVPGVAVEATGATAVAAGSTWRQVRTPAGAGWVHGRYLARSIAEGRFPSGDPIAVVDELGRRFEQGRDITSLVSATGLWISHHAPVVHYDRDELDGVLDDPATRQWGSNALEPGSPEIPRRTFRQAIANSYVDAWRDGDNEVVAMRTIEGPNGRPGSHAIPVEFRGLPYVTVHDPGDDDEYGGLDWVQWIVSLTWEDGAIKVVGLTKDEWAP